MIPFKNLTMEESSYLYGLLITDGFIVADKRDNKIYYKVGIELQEKDKDILEKLLELLPEGHINCRKRDTNFKKNYICYNFYYYKQDLIEWLYENGFPQQNKTENSCPPIGIYDEEAFWRGVIDGDGSLGFLTVKKTNSKTPFLFLTTKSEQLKDCYLSYLYKNFNITKNVHRNARDNIYNIGVTGRKANKISCKIYNNATIYLNRKYEKYLESKKWIEEKYGK